ncbi:hypothetical protein IGI04_036755 [Brassica rapa subsp. trilocularis]|uniref:Uncharacterized protein n=1 Tax=Brassica rapa subsp. trilocularis TaxID=1813537 RepID=A0ABQ7LI22_BRACM|nr:hypothetical protein IGI04_036755 [Brassica rapa subsp. trilocularis]
MSANLIIRPLSDHQNKSMFRPPFFMKKILPYQRVVVWGTDALSHHDKSNLPPGAPLLHTNNQATSRSRQSCPVSIV